MPESGPSTDLSQSGISSSSLPPEKVFTIQIGCEVFKLSGSSIASDAPSYFSQFFEDQLRQQNDEGSSIRTLYIDRDPVTFRDISLHLQGYHVRPRDGPNFVKLFADAQFYSLPRLMSQLFESETFIQIGDRHFQIPRDIFSGPGDSPNFFSLGFAMFFASPNEVFPGLHRKNLLRPPAIAPPIVSNRSGDTFAELLHLLRGYPMHIRDDDHRAELLRDCRYYHLRGLEQKLIPHQIAYDAERQREEIALRLEDIRQSGVAVVPDPTSSLSGGTSGVAGWVNYTRPFVDDTARELIVEMGPDCMSIDADSMMAHVYGSSGEKIAKLADVAAGKLREKMKALGSASAPAPGPAPNRKDSHSRSVNRRSNPDRTLIQVHFDNASHVVVDGQDWAGRSRRHDEGGQPPAKRPRGDISEPEQGHERWLVRNGQWRLWVYPEKQTSQGEVPIRALLVGVKVDAISGQRERNARRSFLAS